MSNWTHVAGIIRIDDIRFDNNLPNFDKLIGKECLFESSSEIWNEMEIHPHDFLPMGSEGSLEKSVWINPDKSCMSAYTISIFGDLRDHDNPNKIIEWFKNKIKDILKDYVVRQAVITVDNERNGTKNWSFDFDNFEINT